VSSSKALAGQKTVLNAKLFTIRLGIAKVTSIGIEYIILITDSLGIVRKTVNSSVYSRQAHFLAIYFVLRLLFSCDLNHRIES